MHGIVKILLGKLSFYIPENLMGTLIISAGSLKAALVLTYIYCVLLLQRLPLPPPLFIFQKGHSIVFLLVPNHFIFCAVFGTVWGYCTSWGGNSRTERKDITTKCCKSHVVSGERSQRRKSEYCIDNGAGERRVRTHEIENRGKMTTNTKYFILLLLFLNHISCYDFDFKRGQCWLPIYTLSVLTTFLMRTPYHLIKT